MSRRVKFPLPKDYPASNRAVLCPAERVIKLYNQDSGDKATRVAKKVRLWFSDVANEKGWAGTRFLPEVPSKHSAGCLLGRRSEKIRTRTVDLTPDMFVLKARRTVR